jgi:hypothetical protein
MISQNWGLPLADELAVQDGRSAAEFALDIGLDGCEA